MSVSKNALLRRLSATTALLVAASTVALAPATAREPASTERAAAVIGWPTAPPTYLVIDTAGVSVGR